MQLNWRLLLTAGVLLSPFPAPAEKRWQGQISHMAILGDHFAGAKVLVGSINGRCSQEFGNLLRRDLVAHGVTLIADRELAAIATEHHIQANVSPGTPAPEIAHFAGPTDIITVEIARCQALPREPIIGTGLPATHISRTEGHFQASLRVADLGTGNELANLALEADPAKQNESQTGSPEYPAASELTDVATKQAIEQTRRLYSPWSEKQEVVYMDDKECNLRNSWDLLKDGDFSGLLRAARTNADACKAGPKIGSAAWYDLAVADMLLQNYDGALAAFEKSQKLHEIRETAALVDQCKRYKGYAAALAGQVVAWARGDHKNTQSAAPVENGIIFDNELVVRLVQGNVADEDIISFIRTQPNRFALNADDLAKMRDAGVPEPILNAMLAGK